MIIEIKGAGGVRNQRMSQDHPNYNIVEVIVYTKKSWRSEVLFNP